MAYDFLQGIDYGVRKGTLGWQIHMAEGGDGTARWLAQRSGETRTAWIDRVNGVSSSFVIQSTGNVIQMLGWDRASGNINPRDRSTDKAFYGRRFLLAVLGDKWTDPNAYTLSVELCGFRKDGPTQKQVDALVELVEESKRRFPGIRGAFGHADQTDTKGCPGVAPTMLQFWDRVGHGLFVKEQDSVKAFKSTLTPAIGTIAKGTWLYDDSDLGPSSANVQVDPGRDFPYLGFFDNSKGESVRIVVNDNAVAMFTAAANVTNIRSAVAVPPVPTEPAAIPKEYAVSVGGKVVGTVTLP